MDLVIFLVIFSIVLSSYIYINVVYKKNSKIKLNKSMSGFEVARDIIDSYSLNNVYITESKEILYSKYDSQRKVIKLTKDIFNDSSLTSTAVAAISAYHAILDKKKNKLFAFKKNFEQLINILLYIGYLIIIVGMMFGNVKTMIVGAGIELTILLFHIGTIQIEIDTKNMAFKELVDHKIILKKEEKRIKELLYASCYINIASIIFPFAELLKRVFEFGNSNK